MWYETTQFETNFLKSSESARKKKKSQVVISSYGRRHLHMWACRQRLLSLQCCPALAPAWSHRCTGRCILPEENKQTKNLCSVTSFVDSQCVGGGKQQHQLSHTLGKHLIGMKLLVNKNHHHFVRMPKAHQDDPQLFPFSSLSLTAIPPCRLEF